MILRAQDQQLFLQGLLPDVAVLLVDAIHLLVYRTDPVVVGAAVGFAKCFATLDDIKYILSLFLVFLFRYSLYLSGRHTCASRQYYVPVLPVEPLSQVGPVLPPPAYREQRHVRLVVRVVGLRVPKHHQPVGPVHHRLAHASSLLVGEVGVGVD